jgi:5-methylcytosine-specific restriction enzyme A
MSRNFSAKVEEQAEARAAGRCENCGGMLKPGKFEFDHIKPHGLGGDNSLENCRVLCTACHLRKTIEEDAPRMRAADKKVKKSEATLQSQRAIGPTQMQRRLGITQ